METTERGTLGVDWKIRTPHKDRHDAIFYTGMGHIADITLDLDGVSWTLSAYCDGDTRIIRLNDEHDAIYRDGPDLYADGITTDEELAKLMEEPGVDCVHNSWFDFYTLEGEHLDYVTHSISDMLEGAEALLTEIITNGDYFNYLIPPSPPHV